VPVSKPNKKHPNLNEHPEKIFPAPAPHQGLATLAEDALRTKDFISGLE